MALLMSAALLSSAIPAPASECVATSATVVKSCHMDCCSQKRCCLNSQKQRQQLPAFPLANHSGLNQQVIAILALRLAVSRVDLTQAAGFSLTRTITFRHFAPGPALLCTFLI